MLKRSSLRPSTDDDGPCAIKVVVRARPLNDKERQANTPIVVGVSRTQIQVVNPAIFSDPSVLEAAGSGGSGPALSSSLISAANVTGECRTFQFDRCFGSFFNGHDVDEEKQRPNQELIFDEMGQSLIESAFQGFNCTMFAYGQTGSGKTHTMVGDKTASGKGVIPRVCEALFQEIEARRERESIFHDQDGLKRTIYSAHVSYCEIYKEKVNDLLDTEISEKQRSSLANHTQSDVESRRALKVREHPVTGPFVEGLSIRSVTSYADIADEMLAGEKLRTVASTLMNAVSSRSHAVFTITFTQTSFDPISQCANEKTSKISMIDLAGSERANVSGTSGDRLKEGAMINKSLTTLGRVISALSKQASDRIPYRDSTLTWLLKESLGGNAKTTMLAMISPSSENYDETMSTLRYAESAKKVMNRAVVNEDKNARIIRQLRNEIEELRLQLARHEANPSIEHRTSSTAACLVEHESFYAELQKEVDFFRSQQMPVSESTGRCAIHLSDSLPSLVNLSANLVPGEALAYVLVEGTTLFGSDPSPDMTKYEAVEVASDHMENDEQSIEISEMPYKPRKRRGSWTSTMLRRRKNHPKSAPSTPRGKTSQPVSAAEIVLALSSGKRSVMQICKLPGGEVSQILPLHARFTCTRVLKEQDSNSENNLTEYIVELESLDPTAIVLVNGESLDFGKEQPMKLHHGDQVRLGKPYCFRIHVPGYAPSTPRIAEAVEQPLGVEIGFNRELQVLIDEANAICTKYVLNTTFAVGPEGSVTVRKRLEGYCCSTIQWDRTMFEMKLQFLREFAASLENVVSYTVETSPMIQDVQAPVDPSKVAAFRLPGAVTESDVPVTEVKCENEKHATTEQVLVKPQTQIMSSLRLLGYGQIYFPAQELQSIVPLSVAVYDFSATFIGNLQTRLEAIQGSAQPGKKRGILSSKDTTNSLHRIRVHLDKMEFDTKSFVSASNIFVTLKETASKAFKRRNFEHNEVSSDEEDMPKVFSTPRVPPTQAKNDQKTFLINDTFDTSINVKKNPTYQSFANNESLLVEIWGYDVKLNYFVDQTQMESQQVEFYVSVDVEEREADGLYHPVAVKPDGALRLHANRSRRILVRVIQSDQQPFALSKIVQVRIAAPDAPSVNRMASMSRVMGKTTQRMLPKSAHHEESASNENESLKLDSSKWKKLNLWGDCGVNDSSRSLCATLCWEHAPDSDLEPINTAGTRSTYRLAIAFTTRWSKVPIAISKSLVTKVCGSNVSAAQRFTRNLEASRTVWWAKESYSRSYRLGTWYAADFMVEEVPKDDDSNSSNESNDAALISEYVVAHHINGLLRLENTMQLERLRQKVWTFMNLPSGKSQDNSEPLTASKVNACLCELDNKKDEVACAFECVQFDSPDLYLRYQKRADLLMNLFTGKVVNSEAVTTVENSSDKSLVVDDSLQLRQHIIHFVSEPTQLIGGDQLGGEMSGFLMLSLSCFDQETAAAIVTPLGGATVRSPKAGTHQVSWERQWFVLKRPFLYAYMSFARKQQTGVMDLSLCRLIVATSADVPFSFRLVCVNPMKQCTVWWLQASTAAEMRAWLVAIDPLKIQARQSVTSTLSAAETPALTA
ncbi:kinesin-like protein [Plasmopara halstedii]|uniref:Kinesin-like protein n=1 Tax=Plasmopara halstedii TaxID=4781 RepID=A0A0P1B8N2_PLAHL|nr:kinesin-like protein [Plasmopara halstedii]CEG50191.1 kinesin-like protein [Plasmopara halstedii]|eukprot:XP_024586560.1 kinesin-like protein [Plasmopara halstedii]